MLQLICNVIITICNLVTIYLNRKAYDRYYQQCRLEVRIEQLELLKFKLELQLDQQASELKELKKQPNLDHHQKAQSEPGSMEELDKEMTERLLKNVNELMRLIDNAFLLGK